MAAGIQSVFVSYTRKDQLRVTSLLGGLRKLGYQVWYDQELSGGQEWWETILGQIRGCDAVLLAVSPAQLDSRACRDEFEYARQLGKAVVPVMIEPVPPSTLPRELAELQLVDYTPQKPDHAYDLMAALKRLPAPAPLPDPLPAPPAVPISYVNQLIQMVDKSVLDLDEQFIIVGRIRDALQDPELRENALNLLARFSRRKDLYHVPAKEVEAMLAELPAARRVPPIIPPVASPAPPDEPVPVTDVAVRQRGLPRGALVPGLLLGLILIGAVGILILLNLGKPAAAPPAATAGTSPPPSVTSPRASVVPTCPTAMRSSFPRTIDKAVLVGSFSAYPMWPMAGGSPVVIHISPTCGTRAVAGTPSTYSIKVTGANFTPGGNVQIRFDAFGSPEDSSIVVDFTGTFTVFITPTRRGPGTYTIQVTDLQTGRHDEVVFLVP